MSNTTFNPFIAKKYGIIEAILIDTIVFWTKTNSAKSENFYNERYWSYGTPEYFTKYFIYLTSSQIKYGFSNLVKAGALLKDNFNKKGYDKTNWYSLSDSLLIELNLDKTCLQPAPILIEQICSMDRTNLDDGLEKFVQPIPSTKPVTKVSKKSVGAGATPTQVSNLKKAQAEAKALQDESIDKIFNEKFGSYNVSKEQLFKNCQEHYEQKSLWATKDKFMKWVQTEKLDNYSKKGTLSKKAPENETEEQRQERQFFEYELMKERDKPGYKSKALKEFPEMREKYA